MAVDWELVKQALEVSQINQAAAEHLLLMAMAEIGDGGAIPEEGAVIYGRNGYTDEHDPRDPDCRDAVGDNLWLQVHVIPDATYRCTRVELLQEDEACNVYFFVMNHTGSMVPATGARLGSPYGGSDSGFRDVWKAPASPDSIFMGPDSKMFGAELGPLASFVVDGLGNIDSDVVGSIGLRNGKHRSVRVYFQER
jgi:hypothetical protein